MSIRLKYLVRGKGLKRWFKLDSHTFVIYHMNKTKHACLNFYLSEVNRAETKQNDIEKNKSVQPKPTSLIKRANPSQSLQLFQQSVLCKTRTTKWTVQFTKRTIQYKKRTEMNRATNVVARFEVCNSDELFYTLIPKTLWKYLSLIFLTTHHMICQESHIHVTGRMTFVVSWTINILFNFCQKKLF